MVRPGPWGAGSQEVQGARKKAVVGKQRTYAGCGEYGLLGLRALCGMEGRGLAHLGWIPIYGFFVSTFHPSLPKESQRTKELKQSHIY